MLETLQRLLAIQATEMLPALTEAATLIAEALAADKVDVFLYQADSDSLVALGTSTTPMGKRQHELGLDRLPLANGGRAADAFRTGKLYAAGRAAEDPEELRGIVEALGVRSTVNCPFTVDSERRGVVQADSATSDFFTERDRAFLAAVSHWISLVMHRAELVEQATHSADRQARRDAADEIARITRREREVAVLIA